MIVNLTQHNPTISQLRAGVVNLPPKWGEEVKGLITFDQPVPQEEKNQRAEKLAQFVLYMGADKAMIGGMPSFMSTLERILMDWGITPMYSFSFRSCEDCVQADGSVVKKSYFRHVAWDEAQPAPNQSCGNGYDCYCHECTRIRAYYTTIRREKAWIQNRLEAGACPKCGGEVHPIHGDGYSRPCDCRDDFYRGDQS